MRIIKAYSASNILVLRIVPIQEDVCELIVFDWRGKMLLTKGPFNVADSEMRMTHLVEQYERRAVQAVGDFTKEVIVELKNASGNMPAGS